MGILQPPPRGGGGSGFSKQASLITLTFQNSALILIMHYSRIMPPTGDHRYFTSTAVFLNEFIKLGVSLTLSIYETSKTLAPSTPATVLFEQIYRSVFAGDGWKLAILAGFFTLQNLLQYVAVGNLDAVHFQVLYQLKIIITALFSVVLLRRSLGPVRWLSLVVLTLGVIIVCLPPRSASSLPILRDASDHFFPRSLHELGQADPELYRVQSSWDAAAGDLDFDEEDYEGYGVGGGGRRGMLHKRSATYEGITEDLPVAPEPMNYSVGVTAVLVAAGVSGLTGVYFEKLLKETSGQASVWIRNVQMSLYSLVAALFGGLIWQDGEGIREHGFFEGYNWVVWSAVCLQAMGGLVASVVIRDADNIVKNFATSISIVLSFVVSMLLFDFQVSGSFIIGTSFVMLSTYLYSLPDRHHHHIIPGRKPPPPIRIASFEKPSISPALTPRLVATPRVVEPGRLALDPFHLSVAAGGAGVGLNGGDEAGLTSSRPNTPMLPRIPSRGDFGKRDD